MQARFPEHLLRGSDSSMRESGCTLPQPTFATMEEVRYAHELRMQLLVRYLGRAGASDGSVVRGRRLNGARPTKERDMRSRAGFAFDDMNGVDVLHDFESLAREVADETPEVANEADGDSVWLECSGELPR